MVAFTLLLMVLVSYNSIQPTEADHNYYNNGSLDVGYNDGYGRQKRATQDIDFWLYDSVGIPTKRTRLTSTSGSTSLNLAKPLLVVIHGFTENINTVWMQELKDAWLKKQQKGAHVIIVDWGKLHKGKLLKLNYELAAGNTKVAGDKVGDLLYDLKEKNKISPSKIHIIGFSLGAHVAGKAGKEFNRLSDTSSGSVLSIPGGSRCSGSVHNSAGDRRSSGSVLSPPGGSVSSGRVSSSSGGNVPGGRRRSRSVRGSTSSNAKIQKIHRITGLDPAGPNFEGATSDKRLDKNDADFVDVIHTNAGYWETKSGNGGFWGKINSVFENLAHRCCGKLGIIEPIGHADFYINGGSTQKGCKNQMVAGGIPTKASFTCDHTRAYKYYIESLKNKELSYGYNCQNYESYQNGECLYGPKTVKKVIGFGVDSNTKGIFFSDTILSDNGPFLSKSIFFSLAAKPVDLSEYTFIFRADTSKYNGLIEEQSLSGSQPISGPRNLKKLVVVPVHSKLNSQSLFIKYKAVKKAPASITATKIEAYDAHDGEWYCDRSQIVLSKDKEHKITLAKGRC